MSGKNKDPIYEEFGFCKECEPKVEELITYIRALENAAVVAEEAIKTLDALNNKLTKEKKLTEEESIRRQKKLENREATDIKNKMNELDQAHQRFINRQKMFEG